MTIAKTVWRGRFIAALKDGHWEYVRRVKGQGAAVVLAVTHEREIVLVEQYRVPLGRPCLELPAGIVGDEDRQEDAAETAARELEEETGFRAARLEPLGDFASSPGLSSETFTLFRASSLARTGPGGGIDGEDIRVHLVPLGELDSYLADARARGIAIDTRLLACLQLI